MSSCYFTTFCLLRFSYSEVLWCRNEESQRGVKTGACTLYSKRQQAPKTLAKTPGTLLPALSSLTPSCYNSKIVIMPKFQPDIVMSFSMEDIQHHLGLTPGLKLSVHGKQHFLENHLLFIYIIFYGAVH